MAKSSIFEKHPIFTITMILAVIGLMLVFSLEWFTKKIGLGDPVIYQSHPIYGYRPLPNQTRTRFQHSEIHLNNLALRTDKDWNDDPNNKILFLGDSITYGGSYIDNQHLFSSLSVKDSALESGNAGVNGWGVLNVHALIHDYHFLPAKTYISVFPEGDFYRGLNRFGGQPYWTKEPKWALKELFYYWLYTVNLKKYGGFSPSSLSEGDLTLTVDIAVQKLKEMDDFLASKGYQHLIFITPSRSQCLGTQEKDKRILDAITKYDLKLIYLADELPQTEPSDWYHDEIHLSELGHQVWADRIQTHIKALTENVH